MPRSFFLLLTVVLALAAAGLFWQWLAARGQLDAASLEAVLAQVDTLRHSPLAMLSTVLAYPVLLQLMFPLTVLVGATGLLFGPVWGLVCAAIGTLAGSALGYVAGAAIGGEPLMRLGGRRAAAMSRYLSERGVRTMMLINLLPIAPFTLTNMLAGAFRLRFGDYMLGSAIGILPGLAALTLLGSQLLTLLTAADPAEWVGAAAVIVVALVGLGLLRRLARRLNGRGAA
jgi:uncharacterized membrane protein YdjX (TVP38/TMEM64 family)